jgi:DNA repair exonuclease SbcCD nuclease subunit
MKLGLLTDTHYNFKKANKSFHDYFAKFYNDVFFPKLEERNIKTVVHLGDAFDNRKGIDYWALEWAKTNVYDRFQKLGIKVYNIVGNHDAYYKNSNEVNAIDSLLQQYDNVIPISSPKEFCIDSLNTLMLPWICSDNEEEVYNLIKETNAKVVFGHLELSGFAAYPGHLQTEGLEPEKFNKFDRVFTGHYHTKSDNGKIFYLGNTYQMFWNDVDDTRGFHIFDTDTYELEYFKNPYNMFERIYYEDTDYKKFDVSYLEEKIVKVVVRQKTNQLKFDKFVDKILKANPLDLKVVEIVDINDGNVDCEEISAEDTLSILDKYVEESEFDLDKTMIKKLLRDVYKEALEVE